MPRKLASFIRTCWNSSFINQISLSFLTISALEFALHVGSRNTVFYSDLTLSVLARWSIFSRDLLLAACFVTVLISVWRLITIRRRAVLKVTGVVWLGVASTFWVTSWGLQYSMGMFFGPEAVFFITSRPVEFLYHLPFVVILMLLALTLILGNLAQKFLVWVGTLRSRWSPGAAVSVLAVMVAGCAIGSHTTQNLPYQVAFGLRGGVFAALFSTAETRLKALESELASMAGDHIRVQERPIVPMLQYLENVTLETSARFNVLLVVVESLRPDELLCFGGQREVMPNVERIAENSILLTNARSQASHSDYADPAILSSQYPLRSLKPYIYPKSTPYPRVLIYDILKQAGWRTGIISSQNEFWGNMIYYLDTGNVDHLHHAETWQGPTYTLASDSGFSSFVEKYRRSGKVDDRYTVDEAVRWIGENEQPFFVYLNLQASHFPYYVPQDFDRPFGPDSVDFLMAFNSIPRDKVDVVKDLYSDSLNYVDRQLGRLFDFLRDTGRLNKTLVLITGDTGQAFYEHGFASHGNALYDEVMRVPIILRVPGLSARIDHRLVQHVDIPPTILQALGFPPHPAFQGSSFLNGNGAKGRSAYLVVQTPLAHQYGIVREDFKLIYDANRGRYLLYDLVNDPHELKAVNADFPNLLSRLSERLHKWMSIQLNYYVDQSSYEGAYPPVMDERD